MLYHYYYSVLWLSSEGTLAKRGWWMVIYVVYPYSAKQIVNNLKVGNTMYINYICFHDAILLFIFAFGFLEIIEQILFFTLGDCLICITIFFPFIEYVNSIQIIFWEPWCRNYFVCVASLIYYSFPWSVCKKIRHLWTRKHMKPRGNDVIQFSRFSF